ncbi:MAG TPA: peptide ABC transporter substrate-binding protein [Anaerolineales bacterium]|nr:peptide ABC transporter substrate-binding protein [Anaerolineales bacterium]
MKKLRWPILIVVLALIAIGLLLLGQQPNLLPILPEVKPATGGIYSEGLIGSMGRLNPALDFYNPADRDVNRLLYSSLLRFDDQGHPVYDLVESLGVSHDGTIYNLTLRDDAVWHDGEPLTSADILFTIDLLRSEELPVPEDIRSLWGSIEVEALDEQNLQFRLPEPYAPFLDFLTFGVLPQHLLGELSPAELIEANFNLEPVGSGPYKFENLIISGETIEGVVLSAFEDYYAETPFIEQFVFRYYPDAEAAFSAYEAGELMGISQVTPEMLPAALQAPGLDLHTSPIPLETFVFLNLDNPEAPFLKDSNVRRALFVGLDRQRMIDRILEGQAILANGPIFPGSWAYYSGIEQVAYDPDRAIKLLKEAGYTIPASGGNVRTNEEGTQLSIELLHPDDPQHTAIAEAIAADWSELGVGVDLTPASYEEIVSAYLEPRAYQAALVDLNTARSPDPDPYPFWHQAQITGGQNYAKWDDRQASEYLEQARVEMDPAERKRLYDNFQVRFASDLPSLPLFFPVYNYAIDERVQGVTVGPLYDPSDRLATAVRWFLLAEQAGGATPEADQLGSAPEGTPVP